MSIQEFFNYLGQFSKFISIYFILVSVLAWLLSYLYKKSPQKTLAISLSTLVYAVCIPGIFALILISYSLFFTRQNLLEVNAIVYFFPIISMLASLFIISRHLSLKTLPGYKRMSGLMVLISIVFILLILLYKMRFLIGFFGSLPSLAIIGVILFFILKWAIKQISH